MKTFIFEGVQDTGRPMNWGKFLVGIPDVEWFRESQVDQDRYPLLERIGWTQQHVWVTDLATGEGGLFRHGGSARADLEKHRIWVCPLFEEFLGWLYKQDLNTLHRLDPVVELPDAQFSINGYRRPGPHDVSFTLRKGDVMSIEWAGENRPVVCDGLDDQGQVIIRSMTAAEVASLGRHTDVAIEMAAEGWTEEDQKAAWTEGVPAEHPYPDGSFDIARLEREREEELLRAESRRAAAASDPELATATPEAMIRALGQQDKDEMLRQAAEGDTGVISEDDNPTQVIGMDGDQGT